MDPVPVAERLLQTKLFGVPVRRLGQSVALPLTPALLASLLGFQIRVVGPLLAVGVAVGAGLFYRTPEGQSPFAWVRGAVRWVVGPTRSFWQPIRQEVTPRVWVERWRSTGMTQTRRPPQPEPDSEPLLGQGNTIRTLDFDYVRDDGVVVTATGYARLIEIDPTPWLILDEASRESTVQAFERYLAGVGSSIQFLSLPVPFDIDQHRSAVTATRADGEAESPVLQAGRERHDQWLTHVINHQDIRDRRHFLVVSIPTASTDSSSSWAPGDSDRSENEAIAELDARTENARSSLPRTGVSTSVLTDRESVLEVFYRYYRDESPPEDLDHGWLTRRGSGVVES